MKWLSRLLICLGFIVFPGSLLFASAKVLPAGVWRFSGEQMNTALEMYAVQDYSGGTGLGNFRFVSLHDFTLDRTPAKQLIEGGVVSSNVPIMKNYTVSHLTMSAMYGISDTWMVSVAVPYVRNVRTNTPEYVRALTAIKTMVDPTTLIPPLVSSGEGMGDITVGTKWAIMPDFAVFGFYHGGFLNTGKDYSEIKQDYDGFSAEPTGTKEDMLILGVNYDWNVGFNILQLSGVAVATSEGLDRSFADGKIASVKKGLTYVISGEMSTALSEQVSLDTSAKVLYGFKDQFKDSVTGKWSYVERSDAFAGEATLGLHYRPWIFTDFSLSCTARLFNQIAGDGVNEFPGRAGIEPAYRLGVVVYYK